MSEAKIPSLDGFRAISVMLVIGGHLWLTKTIDGPLRVFASLFDANLGVRFFFVISGFLITSLILEEKIKTGSICVRSFYVRRILRLFPVYYAFLSWLLIMEAFGFYEISACKYVTSILYVKNYACGEWIDGHLWSLAVEWQFYLVWPIVVRYFNPRAIFVISCGSFLVAAASRALVHHFGLPGGYWMTSHADALMVGALLAYGMRYKKALIHEISKPRPFAVLIALCALAVTPILQSRLMFGKFTITLGPLLEAFAAAFLIVYYINNKSNIVFRVLNSRIMVHIGALSYSLYIWQQPFLASPLVYPALSNVLVFPLNLLIVVSAALVSYYVLEVPVQSWRASLRNARSKVVEDTKPPLFSGSTST